MDSMKSAFEKFYNNTIIQYYQLTNQSLYKKNPNIICCDTNFIQKFFSKRGGKHKHYDKSLTFTSSFKITVHLGTVTLTLT